MTAAAPDYYARSRFRISKVVALSGLGILLFTLVSTIGAAVWLSISQPAEPLPPFIADASKHSLGFLFGAFFALMTSFLDID
jgi:hypothetical protein